MCFPAACSAATGSARPRVRGEGRARRLPVGHERQALPRLPPRLRPHGARPLAPRGRGGRPEAGAARLHVHAAERADHRAVRGDRARGAVRRAGALHLQRQRGHVLRAARGARLPGPREGDEVRGRLSRHARLRADEREPAHAEGVPGGGARLGRHPARDRRDDDGRAVQRPRHHRSADRRASQRAGGGHHRAVPARDRSRPAFLQGLRAVTRRYDVPAGLRRDRDRLPLRVRRRPGVLRRRARHRGVRQDPRRRLPARVRRRARRRSCGTSIPRSRARRSTCGRPARSTATRSPPRRGSPRWPSCASPGSTRSCIARATG